MNINVSDPGLGVKKAVLAPTGQPITPMELGCSGSYASQCPGSHTFQPAVNADIFDEGETTFQVSATDALGKPSNTVGGSINIDRTPPSINLNGQMAIATDEAGPDKDDTTGVDALKLPVYNLEIQASDGSMASAKSKRSGVKSIEVVLDKKWMKGWAEPLCWPNSCAMSRTFTLKLNEIEPLIQHQLRVFATDWVGKVRERIIEFRYIPATGMKDEYITQYFPLPSGEGNEAEEEKPVRPELAVNVLNGNLMYRERDAVVTGPAANLEVERFYNSLLPDSQNTEWGDGWTLAQTPTLAPEAKGPGPATEATAVEDSGSIEDKVELPAAVGGEVFDEELQSVVTKEPDGGYAITDETGESQGEVVFDAAGETSELRTSGHSSVDYSYEGGELAEIAVEDPATVAGDPQELREREIVESIKPIFKSAFGTQGTGDGQFKVLTDVATDPTDGTIWATDDENNRIQHFTTTGTFLGKFSTCLDPGAVEVNPQGELFVACSGSRSVRKYSDTGALLKTLATEGSGNAQVNFPLDLAFDPQGNLWVADNENDRLQQFTAAGTFVKAVPLGAWNRPWGIAVAADGNIWAAEPMSHRVSVYSPTGAVVKRFGSQGSGQGEFERPSDVEIDANGYVWVPDGGNNRVQVFDPEGEYVSQFGKTGVGAGQLNTYWWMRISVNPQGEVFVADEGNSRITRWTEAPRLTVGWVPDASNDDPSLEVEVEGDLVESVEGEEAGKYTYEHAGELLTSVEGPNKNTDFAYDSAKRMTKVTLVNGTRAEIAYEPTYGRVKSVTVAPYGANPKTTYFTYTDEPRRTIVERPGLPLTTYDFGPDGSLLGWWDAIVPPTFDDLSGTLYFNRETEQPITIGDHNLIVQAHSEHGIARIDMIANGDQLVNEKTCSQIPGNGVTECKDLVSEWVTSTGSWRPGIVYIEVVLTDANGGRSAERFWVNIPYTPPPDPEAEKEPTFPEIKHFRETYGLDLDLGVDEMAINDRIYDLIGAWHNPLTQNGELARATALRWGVPLRASDVAELEYRQAYSVAAAAQIPQWASAHAQASFAGYEIDHRAGGKIRVGFTSAAGERLTQLSQASPSLPADRLVTFSSPPTRSYSTLEQAQAQVNAKVGSLPAFSQSRINVAGNTVEVGTTGSVSSMANALSTQFGSSFPAVAFHDAGATANFTLSGRRRIKGRIKAGDWVFTDLIEKCTASYGLWTESTNLRGMPLHTRFVMTAAHCGLNQAGGVGQKWSRDGRNGKEEVESRELGTMARTGVSSSPLVDAGAIRLEGDAVDWAPREIYVTARSSQPVTGVTVPTPGMTICFSGVTTDEVVCGPVLGPPVFHNYSEELSWLISWQVPIGVISRPGDSGSPAWEINTGNAVGLCNSTIGAPFINAVASGVTPLLPMSVPSQGGAPGAPGALAKMGFGPGNISIAR
jgi:sugar lactone lactonase YvrE